MSRIYYFQPYSTHGNYGAEINHYCSLVPDPDSWICVSDWDTLKFTTLHPGHQIEKIVAKYPDVGLFTVMTNRIGNHNQCVWNTKTITNIREHAQIALARKEKYKEEILFQTQSISGLVMIFRKSTWQKVGGFKDGILHIDTNYSKKILKAGMSIAIMLGVYVFHYYRLLEGGYEFTKHLENE